jgi:hypothetical protein
MTATQFYRTTTFILLVIVLFLVNCQGETDTKVITVTIPEKSGSFDFRENPVPVTKDEPKDHPKPEIIREQVIDSSYYFAYITLQDSMARQKMFEDAITIRQYFETFEDETQKIDVYTDVRGSMLSQKVDYTIFEAQMAVEVEIPQFNELFLYGGGKYSFIDKSAGFEVKLILKNKKNNLLSIGIDSDGMVSGGYGFKIN